MSEQEFNEQFSCNFEGNHDDVACQALLHYDAQADKYNAKPLSFFADLEGKSRKELQAHWCCVEKIRGDANG